MAERWAHVGRKAAAPARCIDNLPLSPGVQVKVMGMGKVDEMLYATFPGRYVQPLGWPGTSTWA